VFRKHDYGFPIIFDARTKAVYVIDSVSDEMVVEGRLKYDFWLAVRDNAYRQVIKKQISEVQQLLTP